MILDDYRCNDMSTFCRETLEGRVGKLKICMVGGNIPIVKHKSVLNWCPVLVMVNTFPIQEDDTLDLGGVDVHRSLFYCELHGSKLKDAMRRYGVSKTR